MIFGNEMLRWDKQNRYFKEGGFSDSGWLWWRLSDFLTCLKRLGVGGGLHEVGGAILFSYSRILFRRVPICRVELNKASLKHWSVF